MATILTPPDDGALSRRVPLVWANPGPNAIHGTTVELKMSVGVELQMSVGVELQMSVGDDAGTSYLLLILGTILGLIRAASAAAKVTRGTELEPDAPDGSGQ